MFWGGVGIGQPGSRHRGKDAVKLRSTLDNDSYPLRRVLSEQRCTSSQNSALSIKLGHFEHSHFTTYVIRAIGLQYT